MAENEEAKEKQQQEVQQPEAPQEEAKKKKKKKPNFSKPFIVSGILLGIFAGAPFLNLGNYVFGLWGWVFGLLAAWFFSKEFKYFLPAHGGMVGLFTGLIGSGIAMALDIGLCLAGISTYTIVGAMAKVGDILDFWIPARFHDAIILPPWDKLLAMEREAIALGERAVSPAMMLTGHALFMVPMLAITAIAGGLIGWKLFAKEAPRKPMMPRRRRPAGAPKPPQPQGEAKEAPADAAPAKEAPAEAPKEAEEKPAEEPPKVEEKPAGEEEPSSKPPAPEEPQVEKPDETEEEQKEE